jgi:hypothetical protein
LNFQILLIIILIIIYCFFNNEHFDARVSDISLEKCGDMCTKIFNCVGIGYDKDKKKCYLSTNPIVGMPGKSLYEDEYKKNFYFCNKPDPIKNENDAKLYQAIPKNTIYTCKQGEDGSITLNSILDEKIKKIQFKDPNIQIKPYELKPLSWPYTKKDIDPNYITKNDYMNRISFFDYDPDNEYDGTYMFPNECVDNTPLFDCLKKCSIEESCVGVEYNTSKKIKTTEGDIIKKNLCCPKTEIDMKKTRTPENEFGAFYKKKLEDESRLGDIYIRNYKF